MCGRYYVDDETAREMEKLVREIGSREKWSQLPGDIHPMEEAPVLTARENKVNLVWQRWGFPRFQKKGIIINSRSETAMEKSVFRDSFLHRRAVVPCAWFYEWNKAKEQAAFYKEEKQVLFLAGFYKEFEGEERFVILTTAANRFVSPVHERMPLILEKDEVSDWLLDEEKIERMICQRDVVLKRRQEYEQQTLLFF